jgi:hypothetical protein
MFKKLRCKHENIQTLTNIYGDAINYFNARSIRMCTRCGKKFYKNELDKNCDRSNEFEFQEFILTGETIGDVSDGYHTFDELYYHREILFAVICNSYKDKAWKSWKHHDGTMYDNYFIVGIDTPEGQYSYHYPIESWLFFDVKELDKAPMWDGHKPCDINRLLSLI